MTSARMTIEHTGTVTGARICCLRIGTRVAPTWGWVVQVSMRTDNGLVVTLRTPQARDVPDLDTPWLRAIHPAPWTAAVVSKIRTGDRLTVAGRVRSQLAGTTVLNYVRLLKCTRLSEEGRRG